MSVAPELLRRVPLFAGMTDQSIGRVGDLFEDAEFPVGRTIVRQGDDGEEFLILVEGAARVELDGRPIRQLGQGDFLGEISLIDGRPRTATVVATAPVRALVARRPAFARLIDEHPAVRHSVLMALTERIRNVAASPLD